MQRYLYVLKDIPCKHKHIFEETNETIKKAISDPGRLKRHAAGIYYVVINAELIQIDSNDDSNREWIARECSGRPKWYTDGHSTLRELKKELGL